MEIYECISFDGADKAQRHSKYWIHINKICSTTKRKTEKEILLISFAACASVRFLWETHTAHTSTDRLK
jgi:hypothetical protein